MRKIVMMIVFFFAVQVGFAQETQDTFVQDGDKVEATYYYDNGVVKQHGFFNKEGKLEGTWTSYDVNGKKTAIGNYTNGKKTGKWFFWSADNTLTEVDYKNEKVDNVNVWTKSRIASRD
ncbi:MAG: nicotinic acid mononucleotide adenyltransferase [Flavobacteriaceae bacterium]|nr:nicotinic acid mononucleotide adenyltransferase [Flavobacteriaceae bacterium]